MGVHRKVLYRSVALEVIVYALVVKSENVYKIMILMFAMSTLRSECNMYEILWSIQDAAHVAAY